jgi:hypothetical protein
MVKKKAAVKESDIQKERLGYLQENGFMAWKNAVGGMRVGKGKVARSRNAGSPDIFAIKGGVFYGFEVKKPGGKVEDHQVIWMMTAKAHGAKCFVVYSLDDLKNCIDGGSKDARDSMVPDLILSNCVDP